MCIRDRYYDELPTEGNELGHAFRDLEMEQRLLEATHEIGLGAQFGGKYFAHDIRVIRMPRHGASCPVGLGAVSYTHLDVYKRQPLYL